MARLQRVLLASLLIILLLPATAFADQSDEANSLVQQANDLQDEYNALLTEYGELSAKLLQMRVTAENAADARLLLAKIEANLAEMTAKQESIVRLENQVTLLDVSAERQAYAAREQEIAELVVEYLSIETDLMAKTKVAYLQAGALDEEDRDALIHEIDDLAAKEKEITSRLDEKMAAAIAFYEENDLGKESRRFPSAVFIGGAIIAAVGGFLCGFLARLKDRSAVAWAILGLLFPLIALIIILVIPEKRLEQSATAETPPSETPTH